jgi:hypothetical protein
MDNMVYHIVYNTAPGCMDAATICNSFRGAKFRPIDLFAFIVQMERIVKGMEWMHLSSPNLGIGVPV